MILATGIRFLGHFLDRYTDISDLVIRAINLGVSLCHRHPAVRRHL